MVKKHLPSLDILLLDLKWLIKDHDMDNFCNVEELKDTVLKIQYILDNSLRYLLEDEMELFHEANDIIKWAVEENHISREELENTNKKLICDYREYKKEL